MLPAITLVGESNFSVFFLAVDGSSLIQRTKESRRNITKVSWKNYTAEELQSNGRNSLHSKSVVKMRCSLSTYLATNQTIRKRRTRERAREKSTIVVDNEISIPNNNGEHREQESNLRPS